MYSSKIREFRTFLKGAETLKRKRKLCIFLRGRLQMRNLRAQPGKLQNLVDGPFFMSEISQLDALEAFSSV